MARRIAEELLPSFQQFLKGAPTMAKVLICCFAKHNEPHNGYALSEFRRLKAFQKDDRIRRHPEEVDPHQADIILFVGSSTHTMQDFRRSQEWKYYPEKCFVYNGGDQVIPLLPGIYPSLPRKYYSESWTRTGSFLRVSENANIQCLGDTSDCNLLYSFTGAVVNHKVRAEIIKLQHPRGIVLDTSSLSVQERQRDGTVTQNDPYIFSYLDLIRRSKFILCPRGIGTSTWRLFETMKASRVPVIISDEWVPPEGPNWSEFSIRIPEKEVSNIPKILESKEAGATELAYAAGQAWKTWFSADKVYDTIVECCLSIKRTRKSHPKVQAVKYLVHLGHPFFFRRWLLPDIKRDMLRMLDTN
jgi:hypothetical protein